MSSAITVAYSRIVWETETMSRGFQDVRVRHHHKNPLAYDLAHVQSSQPDLSIQLGSGTAYIFLESVEICNDTTLILRHPVYHPRPAPARAFVRKLIELTSSSPPSVSSQARALIPLDTIEVTGTPTSSSAKHKFPKYSLPHHRFLTSPLASRFWSEPLGLPGSVLGARGGHVGGVVRTS